MACNCLNYECLPLAPRILQCGENIVTLLVADATGTWLLEYEFNGRHFGVEISVTDDEAIELPAVFNEHYIHAIRIYRQDGTLFNDTCYKLDTASLIGFSTGTSSPIQSGFAYANILAEAGDQIEFLLGTPIVIFDGNQSYIQGQFSFASSMVIMTNGVTFYDGQPLTILYV